MDAVICAAGWPGCAAGWDAGWKAGWEEGSKAQLQRINQLVEEKELLQQELDKLKSVTQSSPHPLRGKENTPTLVEPMEFFVWTPQRSKTRCSSIRNKLEPMRDGQLEEGPTVRRFPCAVNRYSHQIRESLSNFA
jgi:hypothetical protein